MAAGSGWSFDAASFVEAAQRSGLMTADRPDHPPRGRRGGSQVAVNGASAPALSVNLSPQEYFLPNLVASVGRILAEVGLAPGQLSSRVPLELLARDPLSARTLRDLAALGITLVADDYDGHMTDELRSLPIRLVSSGSGCSASRPTPSGGRGWPGSPPRSAPRAGSRRQGRRDGGAGRDPPRSRVPWRAGVPLQRGASRRGAVHVPRRRGRLGLDAAGAVHPRRWFAAPQGVSVAP